MNSELIFLNIKSCYADSPIYLKIIIFISFVKFRGGHKLEAAIEHFGVDVSGKIALDSGLSTGGFTDCLLQYGASLVYGVDVGYGQVGFYIIFMK